MNEEAPTIWLVVKSHQYEGYNGREWSYEDVEDVGYRGYFTSYAEATAWVEADKQKIVDAARTKDEDELAAKNSVNRERHATKIAQDEVRRREHDALVAAGLTPSFGRPEEREPFEPQVSKFDEKMCLRGLNWEIVEIEANEEVKVS